jgi:hypothetical protein
MPSGYGMMRYSTAFLVVNKETKRGKTQHKHSMAVHTKGTGLMPRVEETEDDDVTGAIEIEDDDANRLLAECRD